MFKIEKGIPVPETKRGDSTGFPFDKLKTGDSFLVPFNGLRSSVEKAKIAARVSVAIAGFKSRNKGSNFTYRTLKAGVRCWRIA